MRILKTSFPEKSILNIIDNDKEYDYVDSYQGFYIDDENKITSAEIGKAFFSSGVFWCLTL